MADDNDPDSQTEDPTQKRLEEALERGDVAKSQEINTWFMIAGGTLVVSTFSGSVGSGLVTPMRNLLANSWMIKTDGRALLALMQQIEVAVLAAIGVPLLMLVLAAIAGNVLQHRLVWSAESLKPKFSKLSPAEGLKRIFGKQAAANFLKGLGKLIVLGAVVAALAIIAIGDYFFQYRSWFQRQKMSLQEIKEEFKQSEGDPHIKGKIRQLRQQRAKKRMMAAVPKASVIITNPTHYSVALSYERGMQAPICVAKGVDNLAFKIREIAREHDIPIVENVPLARALYATVDIDQEIPTEHYHAVAEVIGYVMRLKHGFGAGRG